MNRYPISVLILTRNEENILTACLESVAWSDDVIVFDSFSTDRTVEIATAHGARVYQRAFDNERSQREASLRVPFKYEWVFNPDADEIATPALAAEMALCIATAPTTVSAFRLRFKNMFMGRWVKRSSLYPTWIMRLFRPGLVSFDRSINLTYSTRGEVRLLDEHLIHYSFNKGLDAWIEKHNRYSSAEASETLSFDHSFLFSLRALLTNDAVLRRKALKEVSFSLPFRPILRFLYSYVFRGGFLDGLAGFYYCKLLFLYESMISIKVNYMKSAVASGFLEQPSSGASESPGVNNSESAGLARSTLRRQ